MPEEDAPAAREEASRKRLAQVRQRAVRVDSNPTMVSMVERLRQRIPGDERFGDRLSTAGRTPIDMLGRGVSAFEPDRPSALHELGLGALQLWQSMSESAGRGRGEQEVTILFTDLVGFSSWTLEAGDEAALELLRAVGDAVETAVYDEAGRIVKRLGDGLMAVFVEADDAVAAALAGRDALAEIEVAGHRPTMRAGVHHGHPRRLGGDFLGVDVNIAARVADGASGGQVLVSDATCELLDGERFAVGRGKRLKAPGAPRELRVHPVERVDDGS